MFNKDGALLSDYIPSVKRLDYEYYFGDGWVHAINVGKIELIAGAPFAKYAVGQGTTPPEDCGGPPGYDDLCEILSDPTHDEYAEKVEWIHDNRNAKFDLNHINTKLKKLKFVDTTR